MPDPILSVVPATTQAPLVTEVPPGTDVAAIVADVAATGVSAPDPIEASLLETVERAQESGIDLSVVVVDRNASHDSQLRDLATAVGAQDGGTVLVLSPGQVGSFSDTVSRVTLEAGQDRTYTGDPVVGANNFVDTLVGEQTPWGLISGLIIVVVAAAAAGTAMVKIRRRRRSAAPTDEPRPATADASER